MTLLVLDPKNAAGLCVLVFFNNYTKKNILKEYQVLFYNLLEAGHLNYIFKEQIYLTNDLLKLFYEQMYTSVNTIWQPQIVAKTKQRKIINYELRPSIKLELVFHRQ